MVIFIGINLWKNFRSTICDLFKKMYLHIIRKVWGEVYTHDIDESISRIYQRRSSAVVGGPVICPRWKKEWVIHKVLEDAWGVCDRACTCPVLPWIAAFWNTPTISIDFAPPVQPGGWDIQMHEDVPRLVEESILAKLRLQKQRQWVDVQAFVYARRMRILRSLLKNKKKNIEKRRNTRQLAPAFPALGELEITGCDCWTEAIHRSVTRFERMWLNATLTDTVDKSTLGESIVASRGVVLMLASVGTRKIWLEKGTDCVTIWSAENCHKYDDSQFASGHDLIQLAEIQLKPKTQHISKVKCLKHSLTMEGHEELHSLSHGWESLSLDIFGDSDLVEHGWAGFSTKRISSDSENQNSEAGPSTSNNSTGTIVQFRPEDVVSAEAWDELSDRLSYLIAYYGKQFGSRIVPLQWHEAVEGAWDAWEELVPETADFTPKKIRELEVPQFLKRREKHIEKSLSLAARDCGLKKSLNDKSFKDTSNYDEWLSASRARYTDLGFATRHLAIKFVNSEARGYLKSSDGVHHWNIVERAYLKSDEDGARALNFFNSRFVKLFGGVPLTMHASLIQRRNALREKHAALQELQLAAREKQKIVNAADMQHLSEKAKNKRQKKLLRLGNNLDIS